MKVGIVGMGAVGAATAMALLGRARISELMLVNRNRARAKGVATDMRYGAPLSGTITVKDGDYADLAGAAAVIVTAGVNEKAGGATDRSDPAGRLRLLGPNIEVYEEIVPPIGAAAPEAVIVVVGRTSQDSQSHSRSRASSGSAAFSMCSRLIMSGEELRALEHSAERLRDALAKSGAVQ
jgi:threonine dehydrogenase-like Zn-dependent dehydrogenase